MPVLMTFGNVPSRVEQPLRGVAVGIHDDGRAVQLRGPFLHLPIHHAHRARL